MDDEVHAVFATLPERLEAEPFLIWRGRRFNAAVKLATGNAALHLTFRDGRVEAVDRGSPVMRSWDFALVADAEAWLEHWKPMPRPGFHDIFALSKFGRLRMEGNLHPLMSHLQYVKDLLALPRKEGVQ